MSEVKVGVGMSRQWDAEAAGEEVALSTLKKLGEKPSFFLLFATIHYEKYGGFKKFLEGVWKHLPEGTLLIGGTVAGFVNSSGSYTRGAVAMAVSYDKMDVATAIGFNTKRDPAGAAKSCAKIIKNRLDETKYTNKFLLSLISGPVFPAIPFIKPFRVLHTKALAKLFAYISQFSTVVLQKGSAREVEILDKLSHYFEDYYILSGTLTDDCNYLKNYQFFGKSAYSNAIVCIGIACDLQPKIRTSHGLTPIGNRFRITKSMVWKHIICSLDNVPALEQYIKATGWTKDMIDERVHTKTIFYPLGTLQGEKIMPNVIALFVGDYLVLSHGVSGNEVQLLTTSGKRLIDAVDSAISEVNSNFGFCISCAVRLEALGAKVNLSQQKLKDKFFDNFLVIYTAGEGVYSPKTKISNSFQETFNIATLEH